MIEVVEMVERRFFVGEVVGSIPGMELRTFLRDMHLEYMFFTINGARVCHVANNFAC
jgi:hypothetical protein